ncbi:hypothetical protein FB567DRAFT_248520 [Paraphoma chrysanthemicola]|uniref:Uncharacterized protein n=1 Tax=Paraphoma chrysanthemicola TaxID=798071 RepID=A0A8K0QUB3_9PLEO|nr:hypothetical protein FB567DRAFT_248520 [Paraphoma chrysanthemicola]
MVSRPEQELNEELYWKVNYELGILDPFVEDPERPPGGKHSRQNLFHPYQNEHEMKLAVKLIFTTEDITEATWALWISAQLNLESLTVQQEKLDKRTGAFASSSNKPEPATALADKSRTRTPDAIETIDLTESPELPSKPLHGRVQGVAATQHSLTKFNQVPTTTSRGSTGAAQSNSTPASVGNGQAVFTERAQLMIEPDRRIRSYKSLQDFYSLFDKMERTSYVSAVFLEAYAEKLRDDMCKDCWLRHNINFDLF